MNVVVSGLPSSSYTKSSSSTPPMPCTTPPKICPSTTMGLIIFPQSSDTMYRSTRGSQVSPSTSTTQMCVAFDHVGNRLGRNRTVASNPLPISSGSSWALSTAALATSCIVTDLDGVPLTDTTLSA